MKFIILGCGSSMGVPRADGFFGNCDPKNKKNYRTRCSALLKTSDENILIDTSPDLRQQLLRHKITKIDKVTKRVSASIKALTENPYDNIEKNYKVGETYEGVVTKIMDYGCFVKIEEGVEGLIHNSELDWVNKNIKPNKVLSVGQKVKFKIVNIDKETKRISLSYKATLANPWEKI